VQQAPIPILLVEDNASFARALTRVLACSELANCEVTHADSLAQAKTLLPGRGFEVILLDLSLPDSKGMGTVEAMCHAAPGTPIVVLTALDDEELGRDAVRRGAQDFLIKTQADDRLVIRAIRYAIERQRIAQERDHVIAQLQLALANVKRLHGLLPICCYCKKVRDDRGYWNQIELYLREHSDAEFSHGLCPECAARHYSQAGDPHESSP
jgi:DNA-binding response OmpR family regulator